MAYVRRYQAMRLALLGDLTRQTAGLEVATGLGGLAVAAVGAPLVLHGWIAPTTAAAAGADLDRGVPAGVGDRPGGAAACRYDCIYTAAARGACGTGADHRRSACSGGTAWADRPWRFEHVRFTYPGRTRPALADVDFAVPAGATVALVGPSGAGKTTIANLLLRFWDPDKGAIKLDGVDLRELTLDGLRGRIALVAQDTYLFNNTLEANVRLAQARRDARGDRDRVAPGRAGGVRRRSAGGTATRVGERGVQLSGGQRQRIAIARAFLKDAPILVLDEATSHLDTISEQLVRSALDALMVESHNDRGGASAVDHPGGRHHSGAERRPRDRGRHACRIVGAARFLCAAGRAPDGRRGGAAGGGLAR